MRYTPHLITLYAAVLLVCGGVLLFVPRALGTAMGHTGSSMDVLIQLLGTAFIGFAATNWMVRHSPVGGIYGRAVVMGNQSFAFIGAVVLISGIPEAPGLGFWFLFAVLAGGTALHGTLLFRGPHHDAST